MQLQLYAKKIWLHRKPIDFRSSIDGLCSLVSEVVKQQPKDGLYLFFNRKRDKLKMLSWHKNGFVLCYKRLEKGFFNLKMNVDGVMEISAEEMSWLLAGLDWHKMREWKELNYDKFS